MGHFFLGGGGIFRKVLRTCSLSFVVVVFCLGRGARYIMALFVHSCSFSLLWGTTKYNYTKCMEDRKEIKHTCVALRNIFITKRKAIILLSVTVLLSSSS